MPRTTRFKLCKRCGGNAEVGVVTGFYVLKPIRGQEQLIPSKQVKGSLPTYGLCKRCLVRSARRREMDTAQVNSLRRMLGLAGKAGTQERE